MRKYFYLSFIALILGSSCENFLDVGDPQDMIATRYVYASNTSAAAAMTSIYYDLVQNVSFTQGQSGISIGCGAAADELEIFPNSGLKQFYTNNVSVGSGGGFWSLLYRFVYRVNAVIEGVNNSNTLSKDVRQHILGEAKFVRAFCYFYLVNLYGNVPLLTIPDYRENQNKSRLASSVIYDQILSDLKDAESFLSDNYLNADVLSTTTDRLRPNKWAAKALLARANLYLGNWKDAMEKSGQIIQNIDLYDTVSLNEVFTKNSRESIWQLQSIYNSPDANYWGTFDARTFILEVAPNERENPAWISQSLLDDFEEGDNRFNVWVNKYNSGSNVYYYPFKYKQNKVDSQPAEYLTVIRLSEIYLIRSEANARLGNTSAAKTDLNIIRKRAGLAPITTNVQDILIDSILHERRIELFTEWGNRWLDLKRTKTIDKIMLDASLDKGSVWSPYKAFFPLPEKDIRLNPSLKQNDGY